MLREALEEDRAGVRLELDETAWGRLETLGGLWAHYGPSMNILGKCTVDAIAENIAEGLGVVALARAVDAKGSWLDVGSGGGFPGLVVAACTNDDLVLVEPRLKRTAFLERAIAGMGRTGVTVRRGHVLESRGWEPLDGLGALVGSFSVVDARAVLAPERWLPMGADWSEQWVFAHLNLVDPDPFGWSSVARVDVRNRSLRAYRAKR